MWSNYHCLSNRGITSIACNRGPNRLLPCPTMISRAQAGPTCVCFVPHAALLCRRRPISGGPQPVGLGPRHPLRMSIGRERHGRAGNGKCETHRHEQARATDTTRRSRARPIESEILGRHLVHLGGGRGRGGEGEAGRGGTSKRICLSMGQLIMVHPARSLHVVVV
jgi:hypothetical protein